MRAVLVLLALIAAPAWAQGIAIDTVVVMRDLPAYSPGMGLQDGPFTLVSLRDARVVLLPGDAVRTDSASTAWDVGFRGTTVIVNGGASGPGQGAAVLLEAPFESVTAVPTDSLVADGENDCPRGVGLAVCTGSGNGWYLYSENGVTPIPDRTLVVRLAEGEMAVRLRFLRYALGEADADGERPRLYTVEYARLPGGTP